MVIICPEGLLQDITAMNVLRVPTARMILNILAPAGLSLIMALLPALLLVHRVIIRFPVQLLVVLATKGITVMEPRKFPVEVTFIHNIVHLLVRQVVLQIITKMWGPLPVAIATKEIIAMA
jgi:hypothetical protein